MWCAGGSGRSKNVSTISMCFSGEVSGEPGDYKEYKEYQEEDVIHDIDDFNRRLISSIHVTEESALRINILEKKRKREVAAAAQVIDKVGWSHKQAKNIVANIIGDTNPTAEWMSVRFTQDQEDVALEQEDVVPDIGLPRTFLSSKRHLSTTPEDPSEC